MRGEVVVVLYSDLTERLDAGSVLMSAKGPLTVEASRPFSDRWIVAFDGILDRNGAEALRGLELTAEALEDPGKLFVHQLIGAEVIDTTSTQLGFVVAVESNPASDLLVLEGGALIPLRFVTDQRDGGATLVVDIPDGLLDVNP